MQIAQRVAIWNRWYDGIPEEWRFQFVIWSLLVLGTLNMLLTVAVGFPFALLVLLGIIGIAAVRVPYALGWVASPAGGESTPGFRIENAGWLIDLNRRYEALRESRRALVYPAILLIAGAINMMLTIRYGFPFGLLFLLALLALVILRAPYTSGWLQSPAPNPLATSPAATTEAVDFVPPAPAAEESGQLAAEHSGQTSTGQTSTG